MSEERATYTILLKLRFTHLPPVCGEGDRVFVSRMDHVELGISDLQDVLNIVEAKMQWLGIPRYSYHLLHSCDGDLVDVDDAYWSMLVARAQKQQQKRPGDALDAVPLECVVRVGAELVDTTLRTSSSGSLDPQPALAPGVLNRSALQLHNSAAADVAIPIRIGAVRDEVPLATFAVSAVVMELRLKRPPICELELCDTEDSSQRITAVCFDAATTEALRRSLRANATEVCELRQFSVHRKSTKDVQFQTNAHPFMMRLSAQTTLKVVSSVPAGWLIKRDTDRRVLELAATPHPGASVLAIGGATAATRPASTLPLRTSLPAALGTGQLAASVVTKTAFRLTPAPSVAGSSSGGASVSSGSSSTCAGGSSRHAVQPYAEPGVPQVGAADVHSRDLTVERSERRVEAKKARIRGAASRAMAKCILCGFDADNMQASLEDVKTQLTRSVANRGRCIPNVQELLTALSDRRAAYVREGDGLRLPGADSGTPRFYCKTTFVDIMSGTAHLVHPRCAHVCEWYQKGLATLEDIAMMKATHICTLCRGEGATVKCYHPDCREEYHVTCALFSGGYVNFGKKDPLLPCPACPKHTQVKPPQVELLASEEQEARLGKRRRVEGADTIVFDSAIVQNGDLRDPDDDEEDT